MVLRYAPHRARCAAPGRSRRRASNRRSESLVNDRAERVQSLARACLARLGKPTEEATLGAELAETLKVGPTGWLSRRRRLSIEALKAEPRERRRRELVALVRSPH